MYIDLQLLFDEGDNVQVYDWRAPPCLFYEGTLGIRNTKWLRESASLLKRDIVIRKWWIINSFMTLKMKNHYWWSSLSAPTNRRTPRRNHGDDSKRTNEIIRLNPKHRSSWMDVCRGGRQRFYYNALVRSDVPSKDKLQGMICSYCRVTNYLRNTFHT